jgi:hypothetical protein
VFNSVFCAVGNRRWRSICSARARLGDAGLFPCRLVRPMQTAYASLGGDGGSRCRHCAAQDRPHQRGLGRVQHHGPFRSLRCTIAAAVSSALLSAMTSTRSKVTSRRRRVDREVSSHARAHANRAFTSATILHCPEIRVCSCLPRRSFAKVSPVVVTFS